METQLHFLKTHQGVYLEMELGKKLFDIRKNDRDFRVGDYLYLKEIREIDGKYTGNEMIVSASFILAGDLAVRYGLREGYCAMSIARLNPQTQTSLIKQMYIWNDKLAILFSRFEGIRLVGELTKDWVELDWVKALGNRNEQAKTLKQLNVNLVRKAEQWYDEEHIKETGMSIFEQKFEFEKWMGW